MNGEGYRDPTADQAIYRASRLPEPIWNVIKAVRAVLEVSHLELTGIQMVDRKNIKKYAWGGDTDGADQRRKRGEKGVFEKVPRSRAGGKRNPGGN